ncbi:MAG: helix-turn-helix domain-containing protein [Deltaproteobacteria bacterium]|nr:helix-turn-helix domain-containing protein [Deltaproteobacteria bacterium]
MNPATVPAEQAEQIRAVSALLNNPGKKTRPCQLLGPNGETLSVPDSLFSVLARAAEVLGRGDAITLVPVGRELTTQQAANVLNISRQYLVRLLEEGKVPFTKTGKHRRLKLSSVLAYKELRDQQSRDALDELTQISQEMGGYKEIE